MRSWFIRKPTTGRAMHPPSQGEEEEFRVEVGDARPAWAGWCEQDRIGLPVRIDGRLAVGCVFCRFALGLPEKKYWKTTYSMSFPRIRPYEGEIMPMVDLADRDLVQLLSHFGSSRRNWS